MWDFFIAHAGPDTDAAVDLYDALLRGGAKPFVDQRCLKLGDVWPRELAAAHRTSRMTIVLVSEHTDEAFYLQEEVAEAIALQRSSGRRVIPIYLSGWTIQQGQVPYGLRTIHSLTVSEGQTLSDAAEPLLKLLRDLSSGQPVTQAALVLGGAPQAAPPPSALPSAKGIDLAAVPLVDRQVQVEWLRTRVQRVRAAAPGTLVAIVGPRGVGKSRIVGAFADWCRANELTVLTAQCVGRHAGPLLPVRLALRPALGTSAEDIQQALQRSAPELVDALPAIHRFLGGTGPEAAGGPHMGGDNALGLYDVLGSVLVRLGGGKGVVLLLEDVHLADPDTLTFLTYLIDKSRDCALVTLVTLPSEEQQQQPVADYLGEWTERGAEQLVIQPFGPPDVAQYLQAVLGEGVVDESEVDFMARFTGGNPLLLGECVAAEGDRFGAGAHDVPDRIRMLLQQRLSQLDDDVREFVEGAAVIGETSHKLSWILRVLDIDEAAGFRVIRRATASNTLREGEDGQLLFSSELLRIVAYEQVGPTLRRSLHLRAGDFFEREARYSAAAHHYAAANEWHKMVPAAFRAAKAAEHVGMYRTAVDWYRRIETHVEPADLEDLQAQLAKALLVVGEWDEAQQILARLPRNDPSTLMLQARMSFVRGDVANAARHATRALGGTDTADLKALLFLANIRLYSGDFAKATGHAERALHIALESGSSADQACCLVVAGACQLHNADLSAAERSFGDGVSLLQSLPADEQDQGVYSALLGNRGFVEELQHRWPEAERSHGEALRLRLETADAVGILESTLALGRVALGQGELESADDHLAAAGRRAEDLDEGLQHAKVIQARGELAARKHDLDAAADLIGDARRRFDECGTPYDVAYADLSLSRVLAGSRAWDSVERLAQARTMVERKGFALLRLLFPELDPPFAQRIEAGLLAYAAGDALGLPWEGSHPADVRMAELENLPATENWSSGSTSDDTALTLLVAEHLASAAGLGEPIRFLEALSARAPSIQGLGPSTTRAIEHFAAHGTPDDSGSDTNGAPMRALPVGWAVAASADTMRREWTVELTRMTHTGREAIAAACVMSACAAWAIEGAQPHLLAEIAEFEASVTGRETNVARAVAAVRDGSWEPPADGISLSPADTVAAVLYACHPGDGLAAALRRAVGLGGDTDTVAALVGGLLGCQLSSAQVREQLPWLGRVVLPEGDHVVALATSLARMRLVGDG